MSSHEEHPGPATGDHDPAAFRHAPQSSRADIPDAGLDAHDPGDASSPGSGADGMVNHAAGNRVQGDLRMENRIHNGDVYQYTSEIRRVRRFTLEDGREVTGVDEERVAAHFATAGDERESLLTHLETHRVLLLSGDAGARKATAATGLALALRERGVCARPPLVMEAPGRGTRVKLHDLARTDDTLRDRVVIVRRALSRGNPDLAQAFARADQGRWDELAEALRRRGACLVFTATPDEAAAYEQVSGVRALHRALPPHSTAVRVERLRAHLDGLALQGLATPELLRPLRAAVEPLAGQFPYAAQLEDFADFYVGLNQPELAVNDALTRFRHTGRRLLHDLDDDFDGWLFGFTLALAQAVGNGDGVRWMDFDRLRRHLHRWLRQDLRQDLRRADGDAADDAEDEPGEVRLGLSDDLLLARAQAMVTKPHPSLADMVRFRDGTLAATLWRSLLLGHRRVLAALVPRLRGLAERAGGEDEELRLLAARILGRIGEMDPDRITASLAGRWARRDGGRDAILVGSLFEGAMASSDEPYRAYCWKLLRTLHGSPILPEPDRSIAVEGLAHREPETARQARARRVEERRTNAARVVAATFTYGWIGADDLAGAMPPLRDVVRTHLAPMLEDAADATRKRAEALLRIDTRTPAGLAQADEVNRRLEAELAQVFDGRGLVFGQVEQALLELSIAHGVAEVMRHLRDWIARDGETTGVVLAMMFCLENGLAARVDQARDPAGGEETLMVQALAAGDAAVHHVGRFVADLHDSMEVAWKTGALVRSTVRTELPRRLTSWVLEAARASDAAAAGARALLRLLARTHDGKLAHLVEQVLDNDDVRAHPRLQVQPGPPAMVDTAA